MAKSRARQKKKRKRRPAGAGKAAARLTPRQKEILRLVAQGLTNREVAHNLKISVRTVEVHRFNLMRRLRVRNVAQLLRQALLLRRRRKQALARRRLKLRRPPLAIRPRPSGLGVLAMESNPARAPAAFPGNPGARHSPSFQAVRPAPLGDEQTLPVPPPPTASPPELQMPRKENARTRQCR